MPRTRIDFRSLTLFEDEEGGSTNMALYATVKDAGGTTIGQFQWNNAGNKVDEVNTYPLNNDPGNLSVIDFELNTFATLTIEAFAKDGAAWPNAGDNENSLGSANVVFDPRVPATLGSLMIGPTQTDSGNTGYLIVADVAVVAETSAADVRLKFENLVLYQDEEGGSTNMAIYVRVKGPGLDQEIFRWNNGGNKVDEVNVYGLDNSPNPTELTLLMTGPTAIIVDGFAQDGSDWPNPGDNENVLGTAIITIDPSDPTSAGQRQLGPTMTDSGNTGYVVNLSIEILPATPQPDLSIAGIEVTQAIQHFHSTLGPDNSVPLVAQKVTLVRTYIDSGVDPSINNGQVPNVTGTLTITGDQNLVINSIASFTAQPIASVDPTKFTDTLNFIIPGDKATGNLNLVVQATVGTNVSNPVGQDVSFTPVGKLNILMVRIQTSPGSAPTQEDYFNAVNRLPLIYPIPTDPAVAINYWIVPGSEVVTANHDLTTLNGMDDFLGDLEDIQEDSADYKKLYGLVAKSFPLNRTGDSRESDNVAFGWPLIMESIGHELGHCFGLEHAPCGTPGNQPDDPDDEYVPPGGKIGEVGVDPIGQTAFQPTVGDFMSYCANSSDTTYEGQWISAYQWNNLLEVFKGL
jgi:hypothetical protein